VQFNPRGTPREKDPDGRREEETYTESQNRPTVPHAQGGSDPAAGAERRARGSARGAAGH
jgi:hypothetical protein